MTQAKDSSQWAELARHGSRAELQSLRAELRAQLDVLAPWDEIAAAFVARGAEPGLAHELVARVFHPMLMAGRLFRLKENSHYEDEAVTPSYISNTPLAAPTSKCPGQEGRGLQPDQAHSTRATGRLLMPKRSIGSPNSRQAEHL